MSRCRRTVALDLDSHEAEALAADFNNVFIDAGARLSVGGGAILLCVLDKRWES